jgi:uncharacterized protein (TIGR03067 family)
MLVLIPALAAGVVAAGECPPIEGLEPLLRPGRVLLLGEMHGTEESPAFALDVACHAARAKLPVVVGLELSPAEHARVDEFLDSEGTVTDREALLAGSIWQRDYQDGRNSVAMADLIDGVRRLRREGLKVGISLFDASGASGGQHRDRQMGLNLAAVAEAAPESMLIVLSGNMHSRVSRGNPRDPDYEPMGYVLANAITRERVVALNVAHGNGSAWICGRTCGVQRLGGAHGESRWVIEIDERTRPAGHQGWYHVGAITASPPATRPELGVTEQATAPAPPPAKVVKTTVPDEGPLSQDETKVQGHWQAYDYGSVNRQWRIRFDERSFHAEGGTDDWYKGHVVLRPEKDPAQIDFAIEDCLCSHKGKTSTGIYYWEDDSLIIAAPQPGSPRPGRFNTRNGQMMELKKLPEE